MTRIKASNVKISFLSPNIFREDPQAQESSPFPTIHIPCIPLMIRPQHNEFAWVWSQSAPERFSVTQRNWDRPCPGLGMQTLSLPPKTVENRIID